MPATGQGDFPAIPALAQGGVQLPSATWSRARAWGGPGRTAQRLPLPEGFRGADGGSEDAGLSRRSGSPRSFRFFCIRWTPRTHPAEEYTSGNVLSQRTAEQFYPPGRRRGASSTGWQLLGFYLIKKGRLREETLALSDKICCLSLIFQSQFPFSATAHRLRVHSSARPRPRPLPGAPGLADRSPRPSPGPCAPRQPCSQPAAHTARLAPRVCSPVYASVSFFFLSSFVFFFALSLFA